MTLALVGFSLCVLCVNGFACFPLYVLCLWSSLLLLRGLLFPLTDLYTQISADGKSQKQKSVKKWWLKDRGRGAQQGAGSSVKPFFYCQLCPLETCHQMIG